MADIEEENAALGNGAMENDINGILPPPDDSWENFDKEFPSALLLAKFSQLCYKRLGKIKQIITRDYEPQGWLYWDRSEKKTKMYGLRHSSDWNYKGIALVNHSKKQFVLVHRGTRRWDGVTWITDVANAYFNSTKCQITPACEFADKIMNEAQSKNYQLIITGHSIGGFLAQVTAFSTKYLEFTNDVPTKKKSFKLKWKVQDEELNCDLIHPHVKAFDSPGAYQAIRNVAKIHSGKINSGMSQIRMEVENAMQKLDITNYVVQPNLVNTTGLHGGLTVCIEKGCQEDRQYAMFKHHPIKTIIPFLEECSALSHNLTLTCWGAKTVHVELINKNKIPESCFMASERDFLRYVQTFNEFSFDRDELRVLSKIRFETGIVIMSDTETNVDKFVAYIRYLFQNQYSERLRKYAIEHFSVPTNIEKIEKLGNVGLSQLYSVKLSENFALQQILIEKNGEDEYTISLSSLSCSSFVRTMVALLLGWLALRENYTPVILFDKKCANKFLKRGIEAIDFQQNETLLFIKDEECLEQIREFSKDGNRQTVTIKTTDKIQTSKIEELKFEDLENESQEILANTTIYLQFNKDDRIRPIKMASAILNRCNLLQLLDKFNSGCLIPSTWIEYNPEYSKTQYIQQKMYEKNVSQLRKQEAWTLTIESISTLGWNNKVNLVVEKPGMGKTSLALKLRDLYSESFSSNNEAALVLFVSLQKLNSFLERYDDISSFDAVTRVLKMYLFKEASSRHIDEHIFDNFFANALPVVCIFDGFDEVWSTCREKAVKLIKIFQEKQQRSSNRVWVTSRPDTMKILETLGDFRKFGINEFDQKAITQYVEYLLTAEKLLATPENVGMIEQKMKALCGQFGEESFGVPLTLKLLVKAKAYEYNSSIRKPINLIKLYIEQKRKLYWVEKEGVSEDCISKDQLRQFFNKDYFNFFIFYACLQLFCDEQNPPGISEYQKIDSRCDLEELKLKECGLLDGENKFFHPTVAEFMIAFALKTILGAAEEDGVILNLSDWTNALDSVFRDKIKRYSSTSDTEMDENEKYPPYRQNVEQVSENAAICSNVPSQKKPNVYYEAVIKFFLRLVWKGITNFTWHGFDDFMFQHSLESSQESKERSVKHLTNIDLNLILHKISQIANKPEFNFFGTKFYFFTLLEYEKDLDPTVLNAIMSFCDLGKPDNNTIFSENWTVNQKMAFSSLTCLLINRRFETPKYFHGLTEFKNKIKIDELTGGLKYFLETLEKKEGSKPFDQVMIAYLAKKAFCKVLENGEPWLDNRTLSNATNENPNAELILIQCLLSRESIESDRVWENIDIFLQHSDLDYVSLQRYTNANPPLNRDIIGCLKVTNESNKMPPKGHKEQSKPGVEHRKLLAKLLENKYFKLLEILDVVCGIIELGDGCQEISSFPRQKLPLLLKLIYASKVDTCVKLVNHADIYFKNVYDFCKDNGSLNFGAVINKTSMINLRGLLFEKYDKEMKELCSVATRRVTVAEQQPSTSSVRVVLNLK